MFNPAGDKENGMEKTGRWLIGIAIGVAFVLIVQFTIGGFALYIHQSLGEVREQQRANTTLLLSYEQRLKDLREAQELLRVNDLKHIDDRLEAVDKRLGGLEADVKTLLSRGKGR